MCRNIKRLRHPDRPPTDQELEEAALQFVRKITGYRAPSRVNEAAFNQAVTAIATVSRGLFDDLVTRRPRPTGRERDAGSSAGRQAGWSLTAAPTADPGAGDILP